MSNPVDYIEKYPERTKRLLGISYQEWQELTAKAISQRLALRGLRSRRCAIAYDKEQQEKLESRKIRINAKGGGRKPLLTPEEEIGVGLFYLRQMPTFEVNRIQLGISKTEANDTFHKWLTILRKLLPASLLEELKNQPQNQQMLLELLEEIELLVDSTEQDRTRPKNYQEQKKFFSGKQRSHTFKNSVISCSQGQDIIDVSVGARGPASDINLFRQQQAKFSSEQEFVGDKAYVGAARTTTPTKKTQRWRINYRTTRRKPGAL